MGSVKCLSCEKSMPDENPRNVAYCSEKCELKGIGDSYTVLNSTYGTAMNLKCSICDEVFKNIFDYRMCCRCVFHKNCIHEKVSKEKKLRNVRDAELKLTIRHDCFWTHNQTNRTEKKTTNG
ncbi:hypothetical protein AVEN_49346-1 [Araneus ventricosus]|uniref:Uncharacterized protein n=1 Tax=Araneus ventricosus TaxID=182803 RepID=A0A4Y2LPL1_ARAVE|nr:hypothetical protein AVEN_49346-1 [Araneus ventricosus]